MITTFDAIVMKKAFVPLSRDAKQWAKRERELDDPTLSEMVIRAEREGFRVGVAQ